MTSALVPRAIVAAVISVALAASACGPGRSDAAPIDVRATTGTVEVWRQSWEPAADRFWDAVDAWHAAEGTPSQPPPGGDEATAVSAAPAIVAAATQWAQAVPATDLPGDVTAGAANMSAALGGVSESWRRVEACGADVACVAPLLPEARRDIYELRGAQFALRPR